MKTVKISVAATLASFLAWRLGIPQAVWPAHPGVADFFLALITCLILQIAWTDPESKVKAADSNVRPAEIVKVPRKTKI
jgi:1,4-dihydroxy-2-naphthoate octaprenyltransferase